MIVEDGPFNSGRGDKATTECGTIRVEDWTAIDMPHIAIRIDDNEGGYYVAHFNLDYAKDQDWLHILPEDRVREG